MENILLITSIILLLICLALFITLLVIKRNIRNVTDELKKNRDTGYDRQIRVTLIDKIIRKSLSLRRRLQKSSLNNPYPI